MPTNTGIFVRGLNLCRENRGSKCFGIQKENWGVTMHFSGKIKFQFRKKKKTIAIRCFVFYCLLE